MRSARGLQRLAGCLGRGKNLPFVELRFAQAGPSRRLDHEAMVGVEQQFVINALDKLSAIPGFKSHVSIQHFTDQLARVGGAIVEQSKELAPADQKFYDLRLDTGTIPSLPLITGSVLSKP